MSITAPIVVSMMIVLCEVHHIPGVTNVLSSNRSLDICFRTDGRGEVGEERFKDPRIARSETTHVALNSSSSGPKSSNLLKLCARNLRTQGSVVCMMLGMPLALEWEVKSNPYVKP